MQAKHNNLFGKHDRKAYIKAFLHNYHNISYLGIMGKTCPIIPNGKNGEAPLVIGFCPCFPNKLLCLGYPYRTLANP